MAAPAYRLPIDPIAPGEHDASWPGWNNDNMRIITQMPVRALITSPARCGTTDSRTIALAGKDVCGSAQTGSGKTAAFLLPTLERLLFRPRTTAA